MEHEKEVWKDIPGYEGLYQVSNMGRVKNIHKTNHYILSLKNSCKYPSYILINKFGERHHEMPHRIAYLAFVGEIEKGYDIHHINGNSHDNRIVNLIQLSKKEHRKVTALMNPNCMSGTKRWRDETIHHIRQYTLDGKFIQEYPTAKEAAKATGVCHRNILQVAGKEEYKPGKIRKQAGGYRWEKVQRLQ